LQEYPYPLLVVYRAKHVYAVVAAESHILAVEPAKPNVCQPH
jgi:nitroimidazol reductase NimA-like FMN-containing flavoprotein (pyridoxamine 5'-phosphate oxidase superfamily)